MLVEIGKIKVGPLFGQPVMRQVKTLAKSIDEIGLLSPITVDEDYNLIAGLHRLEAAKLLKWKNIECSVSSLPALEAKLAEIDENALRKKTSGIEFGNLLLRRKDIYEALHPETRHGGDRKSAARKRRIAALDAGQKRVKPFAQDAAAKLGVSKCTVERKIRIARNLTPEAKRILWDISGEIPDKTARIISDMLPEKQKEAALLLLENGAKMDRGLLISMLSGSQAVETSLTVTEESEAEHGTAGIRSNL